MLNNPPTPGSTRGGGFGGSGGLADLQHGDLANLGKLWKILRKAYRGIKIRAL